MNDPTKRLLRVQYVVYCLKSATTSRFQTIHLALRQDVEYFTLGRQLSDGLVGSRVARKNVTDRNSQ